MSSPQTILYPTRIDLPESIRCPTIALLNQTLVATLDLKSQVKHACWNVKDKEFYSLHQLFDEIAKEIEGFADLIAERIATLGGIAVGTVRIAASTSFLPEYPLTITHGNEHLIALVERFALYAQSIRHGIAEAMGWGDIGTSDLYTEVSRGIDRRLWFLEAHLQTTKLTSC
jgi:starvation-inducible DNA-binding protein